MSNVGKSDKIPLRSDKCEAGGEVMRVKRRVIPKQREARHTQDPHTQPEKLTLQKGDKNDKCRKK